MNVFDKNYAIKLRQTGNHDMLFDYCLSFPDDAEALAYLAICYHNGYGTSQDQEKAFFYVSKSSELGFADGKAGLAIDYIYGYGTSKDEQKGIELLLEAIDEGSVIGLRYLGYCYEDGSGVEKDESKAAEYYIKAAEAGDTVAMKHLSVCYENGAGVEKDEKKAYEWHIKAIADDSAALIYLGECYEKGVGVKKDMIKAVELYGKAAEIGDTAAMKRLGVFYEKGVGVEKDETKAVDLYRRAADAEDAAAMSCLGECYEKGIGVEKSGERAIEWYKKAMNSGDENAETRIGIIYYNGEIVEKNIQKAFEIFEKMYITKKDYLSAYYLACCYLIDEDVALDLKKAFKLLNNAANQGHILSNIYLIYFHLRGIGTKKNYKKANKLIHLLESKEEYEEFQDHINLYKGIIYYHGLGKKKDINKAKEFFDNAPGVGTELYSPLCDGDYKKANFLGSIIFDCKSIAVKFLLYPDKTIIKDLLTKAYDNDCLSVRGYYVLLSISSKYRKSKKARKVFYKTLCNNMIENKDNADFLCRLGKCYFYGYGTDCNYSEAIALFLKSSSLGNSYAKVYLSYCYYNGLGVEKNDIKAVEVLGDDADKRGDHANILLGLLTYAGKCQIKKDKAKGIELIKTGSINRPLYDLYVESLSSQRGESYVSFCLKDFFNRLHLSFDPTIKYKVIFHEFFNLLFLWIFRNPYSTNLSKKELYKMILEYKSDYDNKLDVLIQHQEPILSGIKKISSQTEHISEIKHTVEKIDEKLDDLILSLQEEINDDKRLFTDKLENDESQYSKLANLITEKMCNTLYKSGNASVEYEEAELKGLFGRYWDELDNYTKKALVSARVFLANCKSVSYSGLDYSGVCISSCSALEQELKLRFFTGYQKYLTLRYKNDYSNWPESMKHRQKNGTYVPNNSFSIGSLPHIFGSKKRDDETRKRTLTNIPPKEKELLNDYIKTILNNPENDIQVFFDGYDSETSFLDRCEDVRCIYRNTAAHTKSLSLEAATACCREIIGISGETAAKNVGQVQGLIYDLVRLTRLPKD